MIKARIDIRCEDGVWADLRIINDDSTTVRIHNPGTYRPTEGWGFSHEAYQVAVLRSFHFLSVEMRKQDGSALEPVDIATLADHLVGLPIELEPDAELLLISVPLHEFYELEHGANYSIALTYGDDNARTSADAQVRCS